MCPAWLRNAAVLGDRGALCRPYVITGCLEAAHRAGASNGTLPTCVTVTTGVIHDAQGKKWYSGLLGRAVVRLLHRLEAVRSFHRAQFVVDFKLVCIGTQDFSICPTAGEL